VRIGSQADPEFLRRVVREFGPFDLIIDDGSHHSSHIIATFNHLFDAGLKDPASISSRICTQITGIPGATRSGVFSTSARNCWNTCMRITGAHRRRLSWYSRLPINRTHPSTSR
jgi:hypothetical protein